MTIIPAIKRDYLMKLAEKGNATMCVWLGKQYLDQKDKQELEHNGEIKLPLISLKRG